MELFEYILLMLAAVSLSNLVNRFIPSLSVPIIQIALGMALTWLPLHFELELNPELFLLLFIAPCCSMTAGLRIKWPYGS